MKYLFIINPSANSGRAKGYKTKIKNYMDYKKKKCNSIEEYSIKMTNRPNHATLIASQFEGEYDVIVAVGGDGTVKEVATGLIYSKKTAMGIIPAGTGNDFVAGFKLETCLEKAIDAILTNKIRTCDVGTVNGNLFLNVATIGFDAEVVKNTYFYKSIIKSSLSYKLAIINTWIKYVPIGVSKDRVKNKITLLAVGIGKQYGGGFPILPNAIYDDGLFDICCISKLNRAQILMLMPKLVKGKHLELKKYVKSFRTSNYEVTIDRDTVLNIDGELTKINKNELIKFKIIPKAIKIVG